MQPVIRALRDDDDMERITALVHAAYAAQLGKGLAAAHQLPERGDGPGAPARGISHVRVTSHD
jgi:hypothetical protein